MNFKLWMQEIVLNEFTARNVYDFYALELAKEKINDAELNNKLIERGNELLDDIINAVGLLLIDRFADTIKWSFSEEDIIKEIKASLNYKQQVQAETKTTYLLSLYKKYNKFFQIPKSHYRYYEKIIKNDALMQEWNSFSKEQKKEVMETTIGLSTLMGNGTGRNWGQVYELFMNNITSPVLGSNQIIDRINIVTQLIHNNGNILEYLPHSFDKALHFRDNANLNQLIAQSSDEVKSLLKSAAIPYKPEPPPNHGQMMITAMNRASKLLKKHWTTPWEITNIQLMDFEKIPIDEIEKEGLSANLVEKAVYEISMKLENIDIDCKVECKLYDFHGANKAVDASIIKDSIKTNIPSLTKLLKTLHRRKHQAATSWYQKEFVQMGVEVISYLLEFLHYAQRLKKELIKDR